MALGPTLVLGFIAGVTILLGLPIGRLKRPAPTLRALLNAVAVGVLLFLVWDVLSAAWEPIAGGAASMHARGGRACTPGTAAWAARSATGCCSWPVSASACCRWSSTSGGWAG